MSDIRTVKCGMNKQKTGGPQLECMMVNPCIRHMATPARLVIQTTHILPQPRGTNCMQQGERLGGYLQDAVKLRLQWTGAVAREAAKEDSLELEGS